MVSIVCRTLGLRALGFAGDGLERCSVQQPAEVGLHPSILSAQFSILFVQAVHGSACCRQHTRCRVFGERE